MIKVLKKIFVLTGRKSFSRSGAKKYINKFLNRKETKYFYKISALPILEELNKIINEIRLLNQI